MLILEITSSAVITSVPPFDPHATSVSRDPARGQGDHPPSLDRRCAQDRYPLTARVIIIGAQRGSSCESREGNRRGRPWRDRSRIGRRFGQVGNEVEAARKAVDAEPRSRPDGLLGRSSGVRLSCSVGKSSRRSDCS
jgi:hypothetical protein